jgi:hypothetical protein
LKIYRETAPIKKKNPIFLIYKEILSGAVTKSYLYEEGLPNTVYEEMRKYFPIYEEAGRLCNCSMLNFLIYEENFILFFISASGQIYNGRKMVNFGKADSNLGHIFIS